MIKYEGHPDGKEQPEKGTPLQRVQKCKDLGTRLFAGVSSCNTIGPYAGSWGGRKDSLYLGGESVAAANVQSKVAHWRRAAKMIWAQSLPTGEEGLRDHYGGAFDSVPDDYMTMSEEVVCFKIQCKG